MIEIGNVKTHGWNEAIRAMRNPRESWYLGDSEGEGSVSLGSNDLQLAHRLANRTPEHRKFLRMISVYADIYAPLYWWKEFDTYKVGTTALSTSTMYGVANREFHLFDFSFSGIKLLPAIDTMNAIIKGLNELRSRYLETEDKQYWYAIIQMLPCGYNQLRTVMMNYEVLHNIYAQRKNHKLDEWRQFCRWIEDQLPYSELITGQKEE